MYLRTEPLREAHHGCRVKSCLVQLSEVLDGADHLRGVGVLVVVPGHDLHLIGVEATKPVFSTVSRLLS